MGASPPLLESKNIGRYAAATATWLLRGVNLQISAGERVVVVGPSGSGKTLLLRSLALLDPLDEGEIFWKGAIIPRQTIPAYRSRVIYLHQRPALVEGTVEDNLRFPFSLGVHKGRQFDSLWMQQWLELLGRDMRFLQKTHQDLSGGEAQITALLRAIQLQPDVLLLDEPTAALDQAITHAVEQCVSRWVAEQSARRTVVWVSHNQQQAARMADRVVTMRSGSIEGGA